MIQSRLVTCFLLFSLCFSIISPCSFDQRISLFRCFAKRVRADVAIDIFKSELSEVSITRMNDRCADFVNCMKPVDYCYARGYKVVQDECEEQISRGRFVQCSEKILGRDWDTAGQIRLKTSFKHCVTVGKQNNKSDCTLLKECTEKIINDNCHESVLPEVINKLGSIFYDVSECDNHEGSGN